LPARTPRAGLAAARYRVRSALAAYDLAVPPVDRRFADDRLDDLVYYVLRDYVGYGQLTVPIRDPHLEDVEANRVGERVKVVPRDALGDDERIPTNLVFEDQSSYLLAQHRHTSFSPLTSTRTVPSGSAQYTSRSAESTPSVSSPSEPI
jgi:hypothetical protein